MPDLFEQTDSRRRDRSLTAPASPPPFPQEAPARTAETTTIVSAYPFGPERTPPLLGFDRVSKFYGPVIGLNEVSLTLSAGITGLLGPNGAGKSTLMKLATGQL